MTRSLLFRAEDLSEYIVQLFVRHDISPKDARIAADILLIAVGTGMVVDALEDLNRM